MKVLVIGLGSIGRKQVEVLKEICPEIEIYALRSKTNAHTEKGITNIFSYSDISPDIDFSLVAVPTSLHKDTIVRLLALNKPIFIEKPVVNELNNELFYLKDEISRKNILTQVSCPLRYHPCIIYLKHYLERVKPRLNEVSIYCGSFLPGWRPGINYKENYSALPELGGGVHLDLIHEIDYAFYLFGKPKKVVSDLYSRSSLEIRAIDYAHYHLEYPGFSATITLNYYRPFPKRSVELVFDNTVWNIDLLASVIRDEKEGLIYGYPTNQHNMLKEQMKKFIEFIKDGKSSINPFEESIEVLKICLNQKI